MNKTNTPLSQIHQTLITADSIVILPHLKSDGDTLGSSIALCRYLRSIGKDASIYCTEDTPTNLQFLDYSTFVTTAPKADLVVVVDSSDMGRVAPRLAEFSAPIINIDHHATNTSYGDLNFVEHWSSTGEIMYFLLKSWQASFDQAMLEALYTAIATDTNRFYYASTTAATVRAVADLMDQGLEPARLNTLIYGQVPFEKKQLQAYAIHNSRRLARGELIISKLSQAVQDEFGCSDTDEIVESLRDIQGVEVALFLYEYQGNWQASLRSKSRVNVGQIALAFGGGGHFGAAGIKFSNHDKAVRIPELIAEIEAKLEIG